MGISETFEKADGTAPTPRRPRAGSRPASAADAEVEWRFNNRENPFLFRDTLARLVSAEALTYRELIA
jgi:hypothetical protein